MFIRNIAIIAHVDHGKTTLVDGLLKQAHAFRDNAVEMNETCILDSNDLERERGITILSKNTAVNYTKGGVEYKINIIDTPGHADFSGEVERVLNMADGALLVIDAQEGPMPQTKFVLRKALEQKLKIIVFINKIDKKDARPEEILNKTEDLFLELATDHDQLNYTVLYGIGREGVAWKNSPKNENSSKNLIPLFETIIDEIPEGEQNLTKPFQMQICSFERDNYLGKLAIGRVKQGKVKQNDFVSLMDGEKLIENARVEKIYTNMGLNRIEVKEATSGDIVYISGIADLEIGMTLTSPDFQVGLPKINITPPTLKIKVGPNTSPLAGREGKFVTSRQIGERIEKEKETNIGLIIEQKGETYEVSGRGELHLSIFLETLRREGYELQVGKPEVITIEKDGVKMEPYEIAFIETATEFVGSVTEEMGNRKAEMMDMEGRGNDTFFKYKISDRNFLGLRNALLTKSKGTAIINAEFFGYDKMGEVASKTRNGAIISTETGKSVAYGLNSAQERGSLLIGAGVPVYVGMVIGINSRQDDMDINPCKSKKLTNMHTENSDEAIQLTPPLNLSLEQYLNLIEKDEVLEITPTTLRLRKKFLSKTDRVRAERAGLV
jgi:GTP-binding protein